MLARVDELSAEVEPPPLERLPLGRSMIPGNAWDDYLQAFPSRGSAPPENISSMVGPFLQRKKEARRAEVESLVYRYTPTIDLLSRGARRLEARSPRKPSSVTSPDMLHIEALYLNLLGIAKVRLLSEGGKIPEALELLMDVCVHARDIAHYGRGSEGLSGSSLMHHAFRELRDILQSREIDAKELLSLERWLQALDDHFPDQEWDLENDLKELGLLFIQEDVDDAAHLIINGKRERRRWRFFYSSRLQAATEFSVADRLVRKLVEARNLPWSEHYAMITAAARELSESKEEVIGARLVNLYGATWERQARSALRLLRLAAHYRRTGEILQLSDPFGGTIRTLESEGTLTAWHRGAEGADWTPKKGPAEYWWTDSIEVSRK